MGRNVPVPPELQHLLEKREADEDRRTKTQRSGRDQRKAGKAPPTADEPVAKAKKTPTEKRRAAKDRRETSTRRKKQRRKKS